ncbi:hypothetical protein ACTWP6_05615 [Mycobacterium sp. 4D054]|uniref:hypothetical protein n=1 Tax=Mycobacterium sp. 4D054 TaxID=3457440 RepID=UPI003FD2EDE8
MLAHIRFRCESEGANRFERDGFRWWRVSRRDLGEEIGASADTVKRALWKLGDAVVSANNLDNPEDQTRAYRPADAGDAVSCQKADSPQSDLPEGEIAEDLGEIATPPGRNRHGTGAKSPSVLLTETLETEDRDEGEARAAEHEPAGAQIVPIQRNDRSRQRADPTGTRLPEAWEPDRAVIDAMRAEYPDVDLRAEHDKFTDYWRAKAGKDARRADWNATWRNWIRRAAESPRQRSGFGAQRDAAGRSRGEAKVAGWMELGQPEPNNSKAIER